MLNSTAELGYRLPAVTANSPLSPHARTRTRCCLTGQRGNQPVTGNSPPSPRSVTILRHCRCIDCGKFSRDEAGECFCSEYIGGTKVTWMTGERTCDPPPEAWHYCSCYDGPQISKDVWVWHHDQGEQSHAGSDSESD